MKTEEKNEMTKADMLADILGESKAWIHIDAETKRPVIYINDGESRYCVKKVRVFDEETRKETSRWVNLGIAPEKKANTVDRAVIEATKELIAEGKLPSKQ